MRWVKFPFPNKAALFIKGYIIEVRGYFLRKSHLGANLVAETGTVWRILRMEKVSLISQPVWEFLREVKGFLHIYQTITFWLLKLFCWNLSINMNCTKRCHFLMQEISQRSKNIWKQWAATNTGCYSMFPPSLARHVEPFCLYSWSEERDYFQSQEKDKQQNH